MLMQEATYLTEIKHYYHLFENGKELQLDLVMIKQIFGGVLYFSWIRRVVQNLNVVLLVTA
jgi:hypothetical protein